MEPKIKKQQLFSEYVSIENSYRKNIIEKIEKEVKENE